MKEKILLKLLNVKSLITLAVIGVFCFLAIKGSIDAKDFMIVVMTIVTFYFTKQDKKDGEQ